MNQYKILHIGYLTDLNNFKITQELTGFTDLEIIKIVGRFRQNHFRFSYKPKGELIITRKQLILRHHFTKKVLLTFDL
jgi:hypothetical protein